MGITVDSKGSIGKKRPVTRDKNDNIIIIIIILIIIIIHKTAILDTGHILRTVLP